MPDLLKVADRAWPVLTPVMKFHARLYRATDGHLGRRLPGVPPMLLLDHVGARSGRRHSTPLVYMDDGADVVLVAAKGGHPHNPAWVHNLRANPDAEVQIGSDRRAVSAREAGDDERSRLWPRLVTHNPQWGRYARRTDRRIPIVILEPSPR